VLISAILGFIAFKEKLTIQKLFGLLSALIAIGLLYYANLV
jgi:hypothetical protein